MAIVKEYVKTAEPVSSQVLFEKYRLNVSPATLRIDMAELTEEGYLIKPHISSGRIPTEKAYHFYIKNISEPKLSLKEENKLKEIVNKRKKDKEKTIEELGNFLSEVSRNLSFLCFKEMIFWQGLSVLFSQPEFYHREQIQHFAQVFEEIYERFCFETLMKEIFKEFEEDITIYIGQENPFFPVEDISLFFAKLNKGFIGLLGPQRTDYQKNIALLKKTKELLENDFNF